MSKAFLSHSSAQKPMVEALALKLGRENCVYDEFNFEVGFATLEEIFKGIETTDLFVLFLSDEALNSDWVRHEIARAKTLKDANVAKQLLILNIDPRISHHDPRIPKWLSDNYNLKPVLQPALIYKKVNAKLRDVAILSHPYIIEKEEIFIGRNDLMNEFERKYYNLDLTKPSGVIVSGFEGVGRRKFVKQALDKVGKLNKFHEHVSISLDSRDSIEDFILRIEDQNLKNSDTILEEIKDATFEVKVDYAKKLLLGFQNVNEVLFILDKGCIIQPNKEIAEWFKLIISAKEFHNSTCVVIISFFRPHINYDDIYSKLIPFHVGELNPVDRQVLLVKYCQFFELSPSRENIEVILSKLNGMPTQIFYIVLLMKDHGSEWVVNHINEIIKFEDVKVYHVIDLIDNLLAKTILLFVAQFEFVSFEFVYRIFGRSTDVNKALDTLYVYGIYDRIGSDKEYIKVHHVISDYISRAKQPIPLNIQELLRLEINKILTERTEYPDSSEILVTIKTLIQEGKKIPEKYFIPSVALRTIIELYNRKRHKELLPLADKVLQNFRRYDDSIVREVRYWTAMALARMSNPTFFEHLKHFDGVDHFFLLGFYRRVERKYKEAEAHFLEALEFDMYSQKARRELVNVLLSQKKYSQAVTWAKENYERNKLNAFHIQGYFISLLRKPNWHPSEIEIVDELMKNIKISHDYNAGEINRVMEAEYEFYINDDLKKSVELLQAAILKAESKDYPIKALNEIYSKRGITSPYSEAPEDEEPYAQND